MKLNVGGMRHARTILHELLGTVIYTLIGLGIALFDYQLGLMFVTPPPVMRDMEQFRPQPDDVEAARAIESLCILWCSPGILRNQWTHALKLLKK